MRRALLILAPIIAMVIAVLAVTWGHSATGTTQAADNSGPGTMALVVKEGGYFGYCDSNAQPPDPFILEKCWIVKGSEFTLSVYLKVKPAGGYGGFQSLVTWTGQPTKTQLNYLGSEIVWPECHPATIVTSGDTNWVSHSCRTAPPPPPLPPSVFKGNLVDLHFECKPGAEPENIKFDLMDAALIGLTGYPELMEPASLKIACVPPLATPTDTPTITPTPTPTVTQTPTKQAFKGDTDGDGCPDVNENLPKAQSANGGGRDYMDPWDWYDVNQDGIIDLFVDILGVIGHYSLDGSPPYHANWDRGPAPGPPANPWKMTEPDGIIDLFTDILGVIGQYSLTGCTDPGP